MRRLILSALLAATAAAPGLAAERNFATGGGFDRVANGTPFDVYVHTGKRPAVHAVGPDDALDKLLIENRGGELRIGTKPGGWFSGWHRGRGQRARIDVTVPMISAASLAGPGNLSVDTVRARAFTGTLSGPGNLTIGTIEAGMVDLRLSGPGDITVSGRARRATLTLSGPGDIHAANLPVADAIVTLSGPGDIDATVSRNADVRLSGPGGIRIRGGAHCAIRKSGPGEVTCG